MARVRPYGPDYVIDRKAEISGISTLLFAKGNLGILMCIRDGPHHDQILRHAVEHITRKGRSVVLERVGGGVVIFHSHVVRFLIVFRPVNNNQLWTR